MHPTPLPYWHDYHWEQQVEPDDAAYTVSPDSVMDITSNVADNGALSWDVQEGGWLALQTGMLPTGVTNGPARPEGRGLEVDKMNPEHATQPFDRFLGENIR